MSHELASGGFRLSVILILVGLLSSVVPAGAQEARSREAQAVADLAVGILTCSVHPCLGESETDVRRFLKGKMVSDGTSYYSDLIVAYPDSEGHLRGLVEWDLDDRLDMISLKITDFHAAPSALIAQVEEALPGYTMTRRLTIPRQKTSCRKKRRNGRASRRRTARTRS